MTTTKMTYYRSPLGERVTIEGHTCINCARFRQYGNVVPGKYGDHGRCGVTLGRVTAQHAACILFPLVNAWQPIESNSSSPSDA